MDVELSQKLVKIFSIRILNDKEMLSIIDDLIEFYGLEDYVQYVTFNEKIGSQNLAIYNFDKLSLKIGLNNIKKLTSKLYSLMDEIQDVNKILFTNFSILVSIIHEMTHALQNYIIYEENVGLGFEFYKELEYAYEHYDEYINNYQTFTFERDAICTSYEAALKYLFKYFKEEDSLIDYYLSSLDVMIRYGYERENGKFISPIERLYANNFKEDVITISGIDTYTKMKLGFQVTEEEFMDYYNNTRSIILSKNNLHK